MKKIFTLFAVAAISLSASAQTAIFEWYNPDGAADYTATVGSITNSAMPERINYANTALGVTYRTICLSGKEADIDTNGMVVTTTKALAAGDVISMTAYRNKNDAKGSSALIVFENGSSKVIGAENDGMEFVNLNEEGDTPEATAPNTITYTLTAENAGGTTFKMTRKKASTNLFITKMVITSQGGSSIADVVANEEDVNAPMYNVLGVQVDSSYKGLVIKNGKKFINK